MQGMSLLEMDKFVYPIRALHRNHLKDCIYFFSSVFGGDEVHFLAFQLADIICKEHHQSLNNRESVAVLPF